ncbi:hypothetical protein CBS101457_005097 [Exobasidium rhododendri]|nr:hypothetical protein CBS101457_005097 [Exobasidium rhododendri]
MKLVPLFIVGALVLATIVSSLPVGDFPAPETEAEQHGEVNQDLQRRGLFSCFSGGSNPARASAPVADVHPNQGVSALLGAARHNAVRDYHLQQEQNRRPPSVAEQRQAIRHGNEGNDNPAMQAIREGGRSRYTYVVVDQGA